MYNKSSVLSDSYRNAQRHQCQRTLALFTPATLRYKRNSRRGGPIAALVATWLNLKPVVKVHEGRLRLLDMARGLMTCRP